MVASMPARGERATRPTGKKKAKTRVAKKANKKKTVAKKARKAVRPRRGA
jgi:hypothetical protein